MIICHKAADRRAKAGALRDRRIADGFAYRGAIFQIDASSRLAIASRALTVARRPAEVAWRTASNNSVLFSAAEFLSFADAVDAHVEGVMQESWQIKLGS